MDAIATAGAVHRKTEFSSGSPGSGSGAYHAGSNGLRKLPTWNTGATSCSTNAFHTGSKVGSDSATPSTGAGAVIASFRRLAPLHPHAKLTDLLGLRRSLDLRQVQAPSSPHEPGVAEVVVLDGEGIGPELGVDVVGPHGPRLVEMLIAIDEGSGLHAG